MTAGNHHNMSASAWEQHRGPEELTVNELSVSCAQEWGHDAIYPRYLGVLGMRKLSLLNINNYFQLYNQ